MGLAPPTGEYAAEMLAANGWPEIDEDLNFDRAEQYMQVFRQVSGVADDCRRQQFDTFDGDVWSGSASGAANREVGTLIEALATLQSGLATVITWHRYIARSVIQAKSDIYDNVELAQRKINALENEIRLTAADRTAAITAVVDAAKGANAGVVAMTAEQILASKSWEPPHNALQNLLDQKAPPSITRPDKSLPDSGTPGVDEPSEPGPVVPRPGVPPLAGPRGGPALPPPSVPRIPAGVPPLPGMPASPVSPVPAAGGPRHAAPSNGPTAPGTPRNPAASEQSRDGGDDGPAGVAIPDAQPSGVGPQDDSPRVAPASATGMPAMPMAPGAAGGGGAGGSNASGAGPGGGAVPGLGGPAGRVSSGQSSGVRPAAATHRPAPRGDRVAHHESIDAGHLVEGVAMAAIPVSPARLERDAMAEAATADAARRRGPDRLQLARRIGAALNAPVGDKEPDFGFFWVTGVTTEGEIVVANSYGLAYVPEWVQLPEQVHMATADDAIPAAERARWTTYPILAVQGWAAHRDAKLRAVIGTEEQLADSDSGAAQMILNADDIPDSGEMIGRSRLEVVAPEAAARLALTPDAGLLALLPPAPATAPEDDRFMKWLAVVKLMIHDDPRRQAPHLKAFHAYVSHAQDVAVNGAHTAADPVALRCAVDDWLYWKHLTGLLDAALSVTS
ncbi:secretion protein EspK [Mycobacterium sp. Aquia_213]|uniref:secretion protein EspK n=1 Tax=Mycobacterium sp. Aquia_213 TaxID=2991728 RepID=UPI00226FA92E|nr:secretion protein EspK [Mycobacterium sp. Aquia_213]WAC90481.1 secretion protein EspK [Mycobacterium sp. Aquia_213]